MPVPTDEQREMANRCRAAMAYSGLTVEALSELTGIPPGTLTNMASRTRPNGHEPQRLRDLAAATGMPLWFLHGGPAAAEAGGMEPDQVEERLRSLERIVRQAFIGRTEQGTAIIAALAEVKAHVTKTVDESERHLTETVATAVAGLEAG